MVGFPARLRNRKTVGRVEKVRFAVVDVSYCSSFVELAAVENWYFSTGPVLLRDISNATGFRKHRGLGSFLVQELKRMSYEQGTVPAARCRAANLASATLQKAGFVPYGNLVTGSVANVSG